MTAVLVGMPNVGKSSVLHRLTGVEVIVSNYAGTSVELTRGRVRLGTRGIDIVDSPGVYSLGVASNEERITRGLVLGKEVELVINVVDATNLARDLALTLELLQTKKPLLLLLNQMDRVRSKGIAIRHTELSRLLGITVIPISVVTGEGVEEVLDFLDRGLVNGFSPSTPDTYRTQLPVVSDEFGLGCDGMCWTCLKKKEGDFCREEEVWALHLQARALANKVMIKETTRRMRWLAGLEQLVDRPIAGPITLATVLWVGFKIMFTFTGWAEGCVERAFEPLQMLLSRTISQMIPPGFINHVVSKGIPEGLLVPFALVLPAILMLSLFIALLEDTGLLPRYAVALDRLGRILGISGQAVIPLALGFGCRTPAVVATRILPNVKERMIVITLLSIVVPCAATLGMIAAVIVNFDAYPGVVAGAMFTAFVVLGWLLKRRMGVTQEELVCELPPLRIPYMATLLTKVKMRIRGFFTEVLPLLVVMSIGVRILIDSGVLRFVVGIERVTEFLFGVPAEAFVAVLITVIQRYLAPLVLLNLNLDPRQATIAISMIALSLPCLPVMVASWREVGAWNLGKIIATGLAISFTTGTVLNLVLPK